MYCITPPIRLGLIGANRNMFSREPGFNTKWGNRQHCSCRSEHISSKFCYPLQREINKFGLRSPYELHSMLMTGIGTLI